MVNSFEDEMTLEVEDPNGFEEENAWQFDPANSELPQLGGSKVIQIKGSLNFDFLEL